MTPHEAPARPRVEGDREREILLAALQVLADVGYDRLTMDAVAAEAKASKATLYRRWSSKSALVIDAVLAMKGPNVSPDTGSLRQDLLEMSCGPGGFNHPEPMGVLASLLTAINIDPEFAAAFRRDLIEPKAAIGRAIYARARARGEIRADLDLELIAPCLTGMVLHRTFVLGEHVSPTEVADLIDHIILPACRPTGDPPAQNQPEPNPENSPKNHEVEGRQP